MCTRFLLITNVDAIKGLFRADGPNWNLGPRYNVTPTSTVIAVRNSAQGRELAALRWDFLASWLKEMPKRRPLVNARAEGIENTPTFRSAIRRRRCLLIADGFYEWQDVNGSKQPWCMRMKDESTFAFAGVWEHWLAPTGDEVESTALITTGPNALMEPIHDRMPVIIPPAQYDTWLDKETPLEGVLTMLRPYDPAHMAAYMVDKAVGNVKADGPQLMQPLPPPNSALI